MVRGRLAIKEPGNVNRQDVYRMRQTGASLQQIADRLGRSKERIRQILVETHGTTKHRLLHTERLSSLLGLSRYAVLKLYQAKVITPAVDWQTGNRHYLLWSPATAGDILNHCKTSRLCKICSAPIPEGRRVYCSNSCNKEGQKYKYKDRQAKERYLNNIKRYRERCRRLALANRAGKFRASTKVLAVT